MTPRRIVLKPGAPLPQYVGEVSAMDIELSDDSSAGVPAQSGMLKSFVSKCRMLLADLETSAISIEALASESTWTAAAVDSELKDLQKLCDDYAVAHLALLRICESDGIDPKEYDDRRQRFMIRFKRVRNDLLALIPASTSMVASSTALDISTTSTLKLPRVEIPTFEGDFELWSSWYKLFDSLIHKNESLDLMQKFSFLRAKLKGVPLTLVDGFPFEGEYYESAYAAVMSHYNDPLKRISRLLDTIYNSASMNDKKQTLRGLITLYRANVTALQITFTQNKEIDPLSQVLIHSFLTKADKGTRQDWEREMNRRKKFATFSEFVEYIEGRCNAYERAMGISGKPTIEAPQVSQKSRHTKIFTTTIKPKKCYYCSLDHSIYKCTDFRALSVAERQKFVEQKGVCTKCFSARCNGKCPITCGKCRGKHNTMLHHGKSTDEGKKHIIEFSSDVISTNTSIEFSTTLQPQSKWICNTVSETSEALLATVQVQVLGTHTNYLPCRGLLDSASQLNLITTSLVTKLGLTPAENGSNISSIENHLSVTQGCVVIQLSALNTDFRMVVVCEIVDEIVDRIPSNIFNIDDWNIPKNIKLADNKFNIPSPIDLLFGVRTFWRLLGHKTLSLGQNLPTLRTTSLGWIVTDDRDLDMPNNGNAKNIFVLKVHDDEICQTLQQFWLLDEFESKILSFEELECERIYIETTTRNDAGKFIVRNPFKIPPHQLGQSRSLALRRFYALEKSFRKNPRLQRNYVAGMQEYIELKHMVEINEQPDEHGYFMPHHAVLKETSTSTKLRTVFDASMPTSNGLSLNQCLMVGPTVQTDLFSLLLRFRIHKIAFTADIVKMYRQIIMHPEDRPYQRIFWRPNSDQPVKVFEMTTVTFGTASAPFLATRCLKALAELDGDKFPLARSVLVNDFYVDDVLTGASDEETATQIQKQLREILVGAGFKLSKWCSNNHKVLNNIPLADRETSFPFALNKEMVIKTLGILWFPTEDSYQIRVQLKDYESVHTKRQVLSVVASIFDPLGLIGPFTVIAKIFMQSLWSSAQSIPSPKAKEHWNDDISEEHRQQWLQFAAQLTSLHNLSIPRYAFGSCLSIDKIELHGFSDASERAYGAAVYIRALSKDGVSSCLYCSKSRVAPLKQQTLPRLELCAALLLSELTGKVKSALKEDLTIDIIRLWSDSQIVLHWISSPSNKWLPFVANRVQKIQNLTSECVWDYVNTKSNPADLISRGSNANELKQSQLWWKGPEWLLSLEPFTSKSQFVPSRKPVDIELRHSRRTLTFVSVFKSSIFMQFSNYWKLVRIVAWVSRFIWNAHWLGPYLTGPLQVYELRDAIQTLVKLAQLESFSTEYKKLKCNLEVDRSSPLASLNPFLDHHNLIRVGGRLQNSNLTFDQQHPFVLDPNHLLSKLIIRYFHESHFHAGPQLLRSILRRQFWILRINSAIRHCTTHCHKCIRLRAETRSQSMAALPKNRVTPNKPFAITGVDYAGPFSILGKGGRHKVMVKAYIALFVCFTIKAVHLELVSDLTSEAFIAALNRFISRRGIPNEIHSDNGTNFVGANNLLKKQFKEFLVSNTDSFSNFATGKGCQWHFIPPHAPHFGGLWEAGVKAVKGLLRSICSKHSLTFEQWATLLAQIEACLNSRPLIPESNDPNDLSALTPGHFLIGGPIVALPHPNLKDVPFNRLKYWSQLQALSQRFWNRWSSEYLNTLQQRSKWRFKKHNVQIGDLVIIREENSSPTIWPLGRIVQLIPGSDGLTRVVRLKTAVGEVTRPITKLVLLPSEENM